MTFDENRTEFVRLRTKKCKLVDEIKQKYYKDEIEKCSNEPKHLQELLNNLTGRKLQTYVLPAGYDNKTLVNKFQQHFVEKIENINLDFAQQQLPSFSHLPDFPLKYFSNFNMVDHAQVSAMLSSINLTNCSKDPFNMKFLRRSDIDQDIVEIFVDIINASFKTGTFPSN